MSAGNDKVTIRKHPMFAPERRLDAGAESAGLAVPGLEGVVLVRD
jgi:hypothetical protein